MNERSVTLPLDFQWPAPRRDTGAGPNFDLDDFAAREQRRLARLVRAAYGVGHTQPAFVAMARAEQEARVQEWVEDALESRRVRLVQALPR